MGRSRTVRRAAAAALFTLVVAARPSPAPAEPAGRHAPLRPAVVVDALGLEIGPVIQPYFSLALVRLRFDGHDAEVLVGADRIMGSLLPAMFEANDCTGPPLLPELLLATDVPPLYEPTAVGRVNELLIASGDPVTRSLRSIWNAFASPPACEPSVTPVNQIVRPTRVLLDLGAFRSPFRLR